MRGDCKLSKILVRKGEKLYLEILIVLMIFIGEKNHEKTLLTTTALVALAGAATAEITVTGTGRLPWPVVCGMYMLEISSILRRNQVTVPVVVPG
jgi:hypothetical protein